MAESSPHDRFREQRLLLMLVDLAGFTRAVAGLGAVELAEIVDAFYALCSQKVGEHGGEVVKFAGDACLACFAPELATDGVDCALALQDEVVELGRAFGVEFEMGANLHLSTVVDAEFGGAGHRQRDLIGTGVIHTFRMGAGRGIRLSEPVYRSLPSERRSGWAKHRPPATYTLEGTR